MTTSPDLSLVIAVYNKPDVLQLVLAACARQSLSNFEVIIADDGSGPAIRTLLNELKAQLPYPLIHLWHEDRGWQKNIMLNNAIRASRAEHIVFVDGDCIPSRHFLLDHWAEREKGKVLLGRRVETSERWSRALTLDTIHTGEFERLGWAAIMDGLRGQSLRVEDGIRIPSAMLRKILLRKVGGMLGSNFSAAKRDLVAINGFDELYTGPGCGEDSDVQYRLSLIGVTGKSLRNLAVQYHVWHPRMPVSDPSWDRFEMVKKSGNPKCKVGLVKEEARTTGNQSPSLSLSREGGERGR
jgi:glycosyltransferase involved in cell wall biosynthesis